MWLLGAGASNAAGGAVAACLPEARDPGWRTHAERAMAIVDHTTRISEQHFHHDEVQARIARRMSTTG